MPAQPGVLSPVPREARFLELDLAPGASAAVLLSRLASLDIDADLLVGIGRSLALAAGADVPGLLVHPHHVGPGFEVPSTPTALWLRVVGEDRGHILHRSREILAALGDTVTVERVIDAFRYRGGDDLSGYEDGTENPVGDAAVAAAVCQDGGPGIAGSSFVAAQQWVHDLDVFEAKSPLERDHTFGRRHSDNEELDDAPDSAHVKRTAQEDFEPEAFMVRRSMPWTDGTRMGLVFLAFGKSFDAYSAVLRRMVGLDDGITDGLFTFTRPISGGFWWCPPVVDGKLDLRALET